MGRLPLYDHLGDIYTALQQYDLAAQAWWKSLLLAPSQPIQTKFGNLPAQ